MTQTLKSFFEKLNNGSICKDWDTQMWEPTATEETSSKDSE